MVLDGVTAEEQETLVSAAQKMMHNIEKSSVETRKKEPCDGEFDFEKIAYLLLFGEYPDEEEAEAFVRILGEARELPQNFTRDVIMKAPTKDIMNNMTEIPEGSSVSINRQSVRKAGC